MNLYKNLRKILLPVVGLFCCLNVINAQTGYYKIKSNINIYKTGGRGICNSSTYYYDLSFYSSKGGEYRRGYTLLNNRGNFSDNIVDSFTVPIDTLLNKSEFKMWVHQKSLIGCNGSTQDITLDNSFNLINNPCYSYQQTNFHTAIFSYTHYDYTITPIIQTIICTGLNNQQTNILPDVDSVRLVAPKGFGSSAYSWEYRIGTSGAWQSFPSNIQANGNASFSFSGNDLLGSSFSSHLNVDNIFFRAHTCAPGYSNIITLSLRISSPHITSVTPVPNTCYGYENGSIIIQFDRQLGQNELLNIFLQDTLNNITYPPRYNISQLEPGNKITWPDSLAPGGFKITLLGIYNGQPTYTDGLQHIAGTGFAGPTAVNFDATGRNVYCNEGHDGTITVNASGGVGNYTVYYKKVQESLYQSQAFSSATQQVLSALDTGTYQIRVRDGNDCYAHDASDNEVIRTVTITQPAEPLRIDYSQVINPKAFGYTDGSIQVILKGGAPDASGNYTVQWTDINGKILGNVANTSNPFTSVLSNLGDGKYILRATDANFALAQAANASACIVIDTFTVTQPAKLIVAIDVNHPISCHGDGDGELYAGGQGGIEIPSQRYIYRWFKESAGNWVDIGQSDSIATGLYTGTYKVKITDANNISAESDIFNLTEPDSLKVSLSGTPIDCNDNNNGTATALITGGTQPYYIQWNTGDTSATLHNITAGKYFAFITDAHGCQTQASVSVSTPNPVIITDSIVIPPLCNGSCNGAIQFSVSGCVPPYRFLWSNGATTENLSGICAGNYSVTVTDAHNCNNVFSFSVPEPPATTVDLGPDVTLCRDQTYTMYATSQDPQATYLWNSNNGFTANTPSVTVDKAGTYWVQVTTSKGCIARDTVVVHKSEAVISSEFVVSTEVFAGQPIDFVNISNPAPESVEWIVPDTGAITISSSNSNVLELVFADTGTYSIALKAKVGDCEKIFSKDVHVLQSTSFNDPGDVVQPFITDFAVYPNPNNGSFNVKIGLQESSPVRLRLIDISTGRMVDTRSASGSSSYQLQYNVTASKSVYVLVLETAKETREIKVIIL